MQSSAVRNAIVPSSVVIKGAEPLKSAAQAPTIYSDIYSAQQMIKAEIIRTNSRAKEFNERKANAPKAKFAQRAAKAY